MSAYKQDRIVTAASLILSKPDDWDIWLFMRKDIADRDGLWPYVNPNLPADELAQLQDEKPQEKPVWRFKKTPVPEEEREGIDIEHLSGEEARVYDTWAMRFERERARWLEKERALMKFNWEIATTIDIKYVYLILNCSDPYSRLTTLKKYVCPSVGEREHQLRSRYEALCAGPRKSKPRHMA